MDPLLFLGDNIPDTIFLIGLVAKKKEDFLAEGKKLAHGRNLSKLESLMKTRAKNLARDLHSGKKDWAEFQRETLRQAFASAVAAAYLASEDPQVIEAVWGRIVGQLTTHLPDMLRAIKASWDSGTISQSDDFAEFDWEDIDEQDPDLEGDPALETMVIAGAAAAKERMKNLPKTQLSRSEIAHLRNQELMERRAKKPSLPQRVASWAGVINRLVRFIATPTYNFFQLSNFEVHKRQGAGEMRRQTRQDSRVCTDCLYFESFGWQPLGTLPLPGEQCICFDRCRCVVFYRYSNTEIPSPDPELLVF